MAAPLLTRKRVIKVLAEETKGTKIAATSAIRVYDPQINPTSPFEQRKGTGLYLGNEEAGVLGERSGNLTFSTELKGTGSTGLDAGLAILLQGCGFLKTLEVYNLHSTHTAQSCLSFDTWLDGMKKGLAGAMGSVKIGGEVGKRVMCDFEYSGIWQAPTDEALPAYAPGANAPAYLRGGTLTLGGTSIKIGSFSLDIGCQVVARLDPDATGGIAYYMVTDYDPVITIDPEGDTVDANDFFGLWLAGTEVALSLALSSGDDTITIAAPKVQYKEISEADRNGIATNSITGQCNHSAGNDAVTITVT